MGRSVALGDIREEIRVRYDLPAFSSTTFVTQTAVDSMINRSVQAFYGVIMECYGDNYFAASEQRATSAGIELTSLPDDFSKLIKLHWQRDATTWVPLKPATVDDIQRSSMGARSWSECEPRYRLAGLSAVEWFPPPSAEYSVRVDYIATPGELTNDEAGFEAGPGWEEWVVLDVCRKIAQREQRLDEAGSYLNERNEVEGRIRAQAPERDEGEALQLRDTWCERSQSYDPWEKL